MKQAADSGSNKNNGQRICAPASFRRKSKAGGKKIRAFRVDAFDHAARRGYHD